MGERPIFDHLSLLAEPARVRMLRILAVEELTVNELVAVVQLPQSTVSRQLKVLSELGWVARRQDGNTTRVRFAGDTLDEAAARLWEVVADDPADALTIAEDRARVASVLAQRRVDSRTFFGRVASGWEVVRAELFGRSFVPPTLAALLPSSWTVVDLGCGSGDTLALLAPVVARAIGVDQEPSMLAAARARLADIAPVELLEAELTALPLPPGIADAALCLLVLHHVEAPGLALAEARRVLRPGGAVVVLDMVAHDREEYRETMGHHHLGFAPEDVARYAAEAGLRVASLRRLPVDPEARGPGLFVARLVAAEAAA